jgi:hypothetical protein
MESVQQLPWETSVLYLLNGSDTGSTLCANYQDYTSDTSDSTSATVILLVLHGGDSH